MFPRPCQTGVNRARGLGTGSPRPGFALHFILPRLFFLPPLGIARALELPYLPGYYTHSSRNIKSAPASIPFIDSPPPASSAPPIGHARLPRQPMNASGLTALDTREYGAREYRFRNTPLLYEPCSEIPRLKGGNYSKARARASARESPRRDRARPIIDRRSAAII